MFWPLITEYDDLPRGPLGRFDSFIILSFIKLQVCLFWNVQMNVFNPRWMRLNVIHFTFSSQTFLKSKQMQCYIQIFQFCPSLYYTEHYLSVVMDNNLPKAHKLAIKLNDNVYRYIFMRSIMDSAMIDVIG